MSHKIPSGVWGTGLYNETLLQKITLLAIFGQTPAEPKRHPLKLEGESDERVLTIEQEAEVSGNLAFLSRRSTDSQNVAAIGIEEDEDGEGMVIRVAVNGGMLESVVVGLSKICEVLGTISKRGYSETLENENLLQQVVRLNSSRIARDYD
ncbi:hypothetical protein LTR12_017306 [Friedmanniomyces endolithicus]|nr:hypothetical protein LTR74_017893 [Friedmanniomyces endolithicus]KAK1808343.1 hypothetical protein LTR12_017306 [Friedmanniomyces endolithicus]